ncbi:unnamed protein product [Tuber melanosporum]|uniref:(Perigord truffle) hypothetical protein n=1 Tax=Tuber melanosporum (strain Mel28) TaxID=656061 RepID=D5GDH0_TUBMM|nr:uncharacterized protein GSTUM_00001016001 [Tuber melanosporum]CAZ82563.1 unnamed protein product [Tuber melanosporum]
MNRPTRPDSLNLQQLPHHQQPPLTHKRSQSNGSIENPLSSHGSSIISMGYPLASVTPESAYIAASAATGIVTSNHESFLQDEGIVSPGSPTILVTPPSLKLINQFLDFLLYEFLSSAKSTSLRLLRPAVEEVLRCRLANEAISGADQELTSYLGGGDGEDDEDFGEPQETTGAWDLEGTWKKTRLRCMVYSSLGDLEEDDEAVYSGVGLEGSVGAQQYNAHSAMPGIVSPAVAIWLTAVLEFVGEQTLLVAGHAAINRFAQKLPTNEAREMSDATERPVVEELDTEKVALNPSLSRLWRQWRKRVRGRSSFSIPSLQRHERRASTSSRTSASGLTTGNTLRGEPSAAKGTFGGDEAPVVGVDKEVEFGDDTATLEANKEALLTPIVEAAPPAGGDAERPESRKVELMSLGELMELEITGKLEKRRPQSLILLPWTTESPFVTRSPSIKRPCSLPDLTRGDFPDPVAEDEGERTGSDNLEIAKGEVETGEAAETDQAFYTPAEEQKGWPAEPGKELESVVETYEQPDGSIINQYSNSEMVQAKREFSEDGAIGTESPETAEKLVSVSGNDEDLNGEIGVAHTSDVLVAPPVSLSSSRARCEEVEETPMHQPQQEDEVGRAPASPVCHVAAASSDVSSMHSAGIVETPRSTEDQPPPVPERAAKRPSTAPAASDRTRAVDNAVVSDDDILVVINRQGSGMETSTYPGASLTGNGNSSHSKKGSSTSSKHSQYSQLSDRKIGQLTLVQPSSSSCISISSERANGVRVWTSPSTPDKSRRSSSFSKAQRPIYSSGSSTSQSSAKFKSFVPWSVGSAGHSKAPESDDESHSSLHSERQSAKLANMDERERSFEELISRGDTIHCTITPGPIRRIEGSPRSTTQTADLVEFLRTGPDGTERPRTVTSNKSGSRPSSARAKAIITKDPISGDSIAPTHTLRSTTSPPITTLAFAGPPPPSRHFDTTTQTVKMPSLFGPLSATTTLRADGFGSKPPSSPSGIIIPAVMKQQRSDTPSTVHSRPKNHLVPRDASGSTSSASTSALADFFRNTTPPVDGEHTIQRRISRSVAPFRNTMDSAQFDAARDPERTEPVDSIPGGLGLGLNSAPEDSYQSSFSSSTALLRSNSGRAHDYGSMPAPQRKQTRVRDSLAVVDIEEQDDPDLVGLELVIPKRKEEESLIDFLRNVAPPPQPPEDPRDKAQKKNSSVSLMGRFTRSSTRKNSIASNADRVIPMVPQLPALLDGPAKYVPLLSDTDHMSPHHSSNAPPPSLSAKRHDSYRLTSDLREHRMMGNGGVQVRVQYQARDARVERDDTDSLVDFLKYTSPPPPMSTDASPSMLKEEGPKFKLSFGRKLKRNEVY